MPTIQVRTDDQTKNDSAALFEKLGITMSEAINLFLRQAVMRGEIPFKLSLYPTSSQERSVRVPDENRRALGSAEIAAERKETYTTSLENEILIDAIRRYKTVNNKTNFDIAKIEPFIHAIEKIDSIRNTRMTLQESAVKFRLNYKNNDYVLDYNFEEPDNVFILSRKDGKLFVKDCDLSDIQETLERF